MKIYKTQQEVEKDIKNGILDLQFKDVTFKCDIDIKADIVNARDINARNIKAWYIKSWNIDARDINAINIKADDINARDINAINIKADDINARDINAINIKADDINARDINAWDTKAKNISCYSFCNVYNDISCETIEGRRANHVPPVCLEVKLTIKKPEPEEMTLEEVCKELGREIKIKK